MQPEIQSYFRKFAGKYDIIPYVKFHHTVAGGTWHDNAAIWVVEVQDLETKKRSIKRCKFLISAVGGLTILKKCDIPGTSYSDGRIFRSTK